MIEKKSTDLFRIAQCSNDQCKAKYLIDPKKLKNDCDFLCPSCKEKMINHHLIQCKSCQNIVGLLHIMGDEKPAIFYIDECENCKFDFKPLPVKSTGMMMQRIM